MALMVSASSWAQTTETSIEDKLAASLRELTNVQEAISKEKVPMIKGLHSLEDEVLSVRLEYKQVQSQLDGRNMDLNNLRNEIKDRKNEKAFISNLLGEYIRNFQGRLHGAELARYREVMDAALLAPDNSNLSTEEVFLCQTDLIDAAIKRLQDGVGGASFKGTATGGDGLVKYGDYVLLGPIALFASEDGKVAGIAEQDVDSVEPRVAAFSDPSLADKVRETVQNKAGTFPFDPSLGNARKIEETKESFLSIHKSKGNLFGLIERDCHVGKGGYIGMVIIVMFIASIGITIYKWIQLSRIPTFSEQDVLPVLKAMRRRDHSTAAAEIEKLKGPTGQMLKSGIEHINEPKDLVEEVMYEEMLKTKINVNTLTPFLAVCASSAPLMGLLGTVTGIINTFKVITVFGAGDVKSLSGGISEALVTTEFGLVVAVSTLVLHAFLSRKGKGISDKMEQVAILFLNRAYGVKEEVETPVELEMPKSQTKKSDLKPAAAVS